MKFSDGMWLLRPGVAAIHPVEVDSAVIDGSGLVVYAATRHVAHRGDTLNRPLITLRFTPVAEGVIKVRIERWNGGLQKGPSFSIDEPGCESTCEIDDTAATLSAGSLSVRIERAGQWAVRFFVDGVEVTGSLGRSLAFLDVDPASVSEGVTLLGGGQDTAYVREQLALGVGERIYGLGERFTPFVKNGQSVAIVNEDGGTASQQSYKSIPFYVSSAGYGVLVAHPEKVDFEVGSEAVEAVQFSVPGQVLEYYVIGGPTPKDVLHRYTALTGRAPLVPAWSYGLWLSTSFTTDYDEATVTAAVDEMMRRELPLSVFHFDCFWMREYQWCDFCWDARVFPDPAGMIRRLHDRGLHVSLWINPYIGQRSPLFAEGAEKGYLLKRDDGGVWQCDLWQPGMGIVDLTNPDARTWWTSKLKALLDMGVDCFKTDFGERIPIDGVAWFDGSSPTKMHNWYAQLYNETVFKLLQREKGEGEAVVFARAATVGGQRQPVHWGGDSLSSYPSMAETLRGGLSLAMSGFAYWSHDIGGFEGTPPADVFTRWLAFGLLSSHSRLHGSGSMRLPWLFGDDAVTAARKFIGLKMRLMPYLAACAREAAATGAPLMRPMVLEFPSDRAVLDVDTQYMLGPVLLVAPVFASDGTVDFYVPDGRWRSLLDDSVVDGGWLRQVHGATSLPLLQRPDTVLPIGSRDDTAQYDWADGLTLRLNQLADGHDERIVVPASDAGVGASDVEFRVRRQGDRIVIATDSDRPWSVWADGVETRADGRRVELPVR